MTRLDLILVSILLGPLTALEVAGRTPNLFWADIVVLAMASWSVAKLCARPNLAHWRLPTVIWLAIVYVAIGAASLAMTEDPLAGMAIFKLRVMPIVVFLLACRLPASRELTEHFFKSLVLFGLALAAMSLRNWYLFSTGALELSDEFGVKDMLQTNFGRSNYLASLFIIILPCGIFCLRRLRPIGEFVVFATATALMLTALMFTQSRGAMISLLIGLGTWLALAARRASLIRAFAIVTGALAAIALLGALWPLVPDTVSHGVEMGYNAFVLQIQEGNFGGNRTELWVAALRGAWDARLMGIGLGNQSNWFIRAGLTASAHSLYLETLLETGLLGLIALMSVLVGFGSILSRLRSTTEPYHRALAPALIASFIAALANAAQEPSFWATQYGYLFWMMMGVAYSAQRTPVPRDRLGTEASFTVQGAR